MVRCREVLFVVEILEKGSYYFIIKLLSIFGHYGVKDAKSIISSQKNFLTPSTIIYMSGMESIHLVKWFVETNKYFLLPGSFGSGLTISILHWRMAKGS